MNPVRILGMIPLWTALIYGQASQPPPAPPPPAAPLLAPDVSADLAEGAARLAEVDALLQRNFDIDVTGLAAKLERMAGSFAFAQRAPVAPVAPAAPVPPEPPDVADRPGRDKGRNEDRAYSRGTRSLDRREWESAVQEFEEVIQAGGSRTDGARYWKAYALQKLGRRDQALAAIGELEKNHPGSRWLNDAKALQVEVRQAGGQPVPPEAENDEDMKLFAINALIGSDPDRAIPLLEKLLNSSSSRRLKERALFVLAQSRSSKAQDVVLRYAKGQGNPDMQLKAVEYLAVSGRQHLGTLSEIYSSSNDPAVKRAVLQGFMIARDRDRLLQAAKSETNPGLKRTAIQLLGAAGGGAEVAQLYSADAAPEVKDAVLDGLFVAGQTDKIVEIVRTEKDPKVRRSALSRLGAMPKARTAETLVSLYASETDRDAKRQIIHTLGAQNAASELIEIARKENDMALKSEVVKRLSNMRSKEATDFLVELLNK